MSIEEDNAKLNPIFALTEFSYIDTVWFVSVDGMDWLAMVYRDNDAAPWRLTHRFRHYADEDPFSDDDIKNVYHMIPRDDVTVNIGAVVLQVTVMAEQLAKLARGKLWTLPIRGDQDKLMDVFKKQSFVHMRKPDQREVDILNANKAKEPRPS
jgi:hypothetical protein